MIKFSVPSPWDNQLQIEDRDAICLINQNFSEEFADRYAGKLAWFQSHLVMPIEKVLNVGCGYGRESFALSWILHPLEIRGISNSPEQLGYADELVAAIEHVRSTLLQRLKDLAQQAKYCDQFANWIDSWPPEISTSTIPSFAEIDVTNASTDSLPSDYFDLVYLRYVLHLVFDQGAEEALHRAANNIARVLKPGVGRVVVVEPGMKNGELRDYVEPYFETAGLIKLTVERDVEILGIDLKSDDTKPEPGDPVFHPIGYVYKKPA